MKRRKADGGSIDVIGEGRSIFKTLLREIGLPAALGLIAAAVASVWIKRDPTGKYGPMFALTSVALAWGVPRFLLRGFRIGLLDKKTAERAGAFAVGFALGWDNVINPIIGSDPNHIIGRLVRWAQNLVTKDPNAVAQAAQGGSSYRGDSFSYTSPPVATAAPAAVQQQAAPAMDKTAQYIAAGGQALGAILQGVGSLASGFGGSTGATDVGKVGIAGGSIYGRLARDAA